MTNAKSFARTVLVAVSVILSVAMVCGRVVAAEGSKAEGSKAVEIQNDTLKVSFDPSQGSFSVLSKTGGSAFASDGKLADASGGSPRVVPMTDPTFGAGQAIEITYPDGNLDTLTLFQKLPFVLIRRSIHNGAADATTADKVPVVSVGIHLDKPAPELKALGTGGLTAPDANPGSYAWLAVADEQTRRGVVAAWLTHDRGSGVVFPKVQSDNLRIEARVEYGRLRTGPGKDSQTETFALGWFDDARLGLEAWADAVAKVYRVKLPRQPLGYCTWYSDKHGGSSDEKDLADLASFAAKNLAPFGFNFVQIDDGWQSGQNTNGPRKNFTTHNPKGPYPTGMKQTADHLKSLGLAPGIWFMPFAGTYNDPFFQGHADWFAKAADGKPFDTKWGGTCLDMSNPAAREYVSGVARRIARDWGYTYFKIDGMYTGTATRQVYVNSGYKEDHLGESVLHDPDKTHIEAYREGIKTVREGANGGARSGGAANGPAANGPAAGEGVFILGCCAPQNMRSYAGAFGLVDAMRIGPDNNAKWDGLKHGPLFGSRNYFLNGRVWYNDPDPLYVRDSIPLDHARLIASWVTISGQLSVSSDWLPGLSPERLNLLRRTMPSHGLLPRPVDLFEQDLPRVWLLTDTRHTPRRDVVALFNWDDKAADFDLPLQHAGLDPQATYVGFDYWADAFVPPFQGNLKSSLPKQSCQVLAVRPAPSHPQLISTSRHITQGIVDVLDEKWDGPAKVLSGKSKVVGKDPYELRVVTDMSDKGSSVEAVDVSPEDKAAGVKINFKEAPGSVRATIESPASRDVEWSLHFKSPTPAGG